jgi:hypothetical protein
MDLFGATILWIMVGLLAIGLIIAAGFAFADFINHQYPNGHRINTEEPDNPLSLESFEYFSKFFYLGVLGIICFVIGLLLLPLGILVFPVIWTARKVHQRQKRHGD